MSKNERIREMERLKQCEKSVDLIMGEDDPDKILEELKALTLRWYTNGLTDGIDFGNERLIEDCEFN